MDEGANPGIIHPKKYEVVRVHWRDAANYPGWKSLADIEDIASDRCPLIQTIGWLIYRNDEFLLVAQSVGEKSASEILKIPSRYIDDMWIQSVDPTEKEEKEEKAEKEEKKEIENGKKEDKNSPAPET